MQRLTRLSRPPDPQTVVDNMNYDFLYVTSPLLLFGTAQAISGQPFLSLVLSSIICIVINVWSKEHRRRTRVGALFVGVLLCASAAAFMADVTSQYTVLTIGGLYLGMVLWDYAKAEDLG